MEPIERLEHFRKIQKIGFKEFEQSLGFAINAYRTALSRRSSLSTTTVQHIVTNYPELSLKWIFTGFGDVVESKVTNQALKTDSFGEPDLLYLYDLIDVVSKTPTVENVSQLKRGLVRLFSLYNGLKGELYEIKKLSDEIN